MFGGLKLKNKNTEGELRNFPYIILKAMPHMLQKQAIHFNFLNEVRAWLYIFARIRLSTDWLLNPSWVDHKTG